MQQMDDSQTFLIRPVDVREQRNSRKQVIVCFRLVYVLPEQQHAVTQPTSSSPSVYGVSATYVQHQAHIAEVR